MLLNRNKHNGLECFRCFFCWCDRCLSVFRARTSFLNTSSLFQSHYCNARFAYLRNPEVRTPSWGMPRSGWQSTRRVTMGRKKSVSFYINFVSTLKITCIFLRDVIICDMIQAIQNGDLNGLKYVQ